MNEKVKTNVSGMNVISQSEGEASYTIEYTEYSILLIKKL